MPLATYIDERPHYFNKSNFIKQVAKIVIVYRFDAR